MEKEKKQETRAIYHCSFCGKSQDQIQRLVAGPGGVYICDECIDFCRKSIEKGEDLSLESMRKRLAVKKRELICSTCGTHCPENYRYCFNCGASLTQEQS